MPKSRQRTAVSRTSSHDHRPLNPSSLRQTYTASVSPPTSSDTMAPRPVAGPSGPSGPSAGPNPVASPPTEATSLLAGGAKDEDAGAPPSEPPYHHGTFPSRPDTPTDDATRGLLFGDGSERSTLSSRRETPSPGDDWWARLARSVRSKKMSQTSALAERAGFEDSLIMCVSSACSALVCSDPSKPERFCPLVQLTNGMHPPT